MKDLRYFKSNDGIALIMVLWTIVILSFLLISLSEDIKLESFLTRNLMNHNQIQYVAQAGIARGMAELTRDKSIADGLAETWLTPIEGELADLGTFEVTIEEIGSRFNINYVGEPVLEKLVSDFGPEFEEWRVENWPISLFQELDDFSQGDFEDMQEWITFYGNYNLNTDDRSILKEMMIRQRVSDWIADQVVQELEKLEEPLRSVDDLLLKAPSLDMSTFGLIRQDVDVVGNLNVNLVDEEILMLLMDALRISQDQVVAITTLREKETIEDLRVLEQSLGEEAYKKMVPYLNVSSRYFRIISVAKAVATSNEKTIVIEVERIPEKVARGQVLEWGTKILSWVES